MHQTIKRNSVVFLAMILVCLKSFAQQTINSGPLNIMVQGYQRIDLSQVLGQYVDASQVQRVILQATPSYYSYLTASLVTQNNLPASSQISVMGNINRDVLITNAMTNGSLALQLSGQGHVAGLQVVMKPMGGGYGQPPTPPSSGVAETLRVPVNIRTSSYQSVVDVAQYIPQARGLKLLRVEVQAASLGQLASIRLAINGQIVTGAQSADYRGRTLRFDTGMFKGQVIGSQITHINLLVQGAADIKTITIRGARVATPPTTGYSNGHGGNGQANGYGNGQAHGNGGNGQANGYGNGQAHGNGGNGQANGNGGNGQAHGNGGNNGIQNGLIEVPLNQTLENNEKIELKDIMPITLPTSSELIEVEIEAKGHGDKSRLIVRVGSNLLGSLSFGGTMEKKKITASETIDLNDFVVSSKDKVEIKSITIRIKP